MLSQWCECEIEGAFAEVVIVAVALDRGEELEWSTTCCVSDGSS